MTLSLVSWEHHVTSHPSRCGCWRRALHEILPQTLHLTSSRHVDWPKTSAPFQLHPNVKGSRELNISDNSYGRIVFGFTALIFLQIRPPLATEQAVNAEFITSERCNPRVIHPQVSGATRRRGMRGSPFDLYDSAWHPISSIGVCPAPITCPVSLTPTTGICYRPSHLGSASSVCSTCLRLQFAISRQWVTYVWVQSLNLKIEFSERVLLFVPVIFLVTTSNVPVVPVNCLRYGSDKRVEGLCYGLEAQPQRTEGKNFSSVFLNPR